MDLLLREPSHGHMLYRYNQLWELIDTSWMSWACYCWGQTALEKHLTALIWQTQIPSWGQLSVNPLWVTSLFLLSVICLESISWTLYSSTEVYKTTTSTSGLCQSQCCRWWWRFTFRWLYRRYHHWFAYRFSNNGITSWCYQRCTSRLNSPWS